MKDAEIKSEILKVLNNNMYWFDYQYSKDLKTTLNIKIVDRNKAAEKLVELFKKLKL